MGIYNIQNLLSTPIPDEASKALIADAVDRRLFGEYYLDHVDYDSDKDEATVALYLKSGDDASRLKNNVTFTFTGDHLGDVIAFLSGEKLTAEQCQKLVNSQKIRVNFNVVDDDLVIKMISMKHSWQPWGMFSTLLGKKVNGEDRVQALAMLTYTELTLSRKLCAATESTLASVNSICGFFTHKAKEMQESVEKTIGYYAGYHD